MICIAPKTGALFLNKPMSYLCNSLDPPVIVSFVLPSVRTYWNAK